MSFWTPFFLPLPKGSPPPPQVQGRGFYVAHFVRRSWTEPESEACGCDTQGAAGRTVRAVLCPGSGTSPLSSFPIISVHFPATGPPSGLQFPHRLCRRASQRLHAKFAEDNESFHHLQGRQRSPQFPGLRKDFLLFTRPHECRLVHGAQALGLKRDPRRKEWLRADGKAGCCHSLPTCP